MTMARFALFGSVEPSSSQSSSASSSSASLTSLRQSPEADCQSDVVATADRRISSNPSITMPESIADSNLDQTSCQSQSMRASHSDTNLMERFRKGNFVASFVGVRKSFSLQKRKSKKDKKKKAKESQNTDPSVSSNTDLASDNTISAQLSTERFVSVVDEHNETSDKDVSSEQAVERLPLAIRGLPSSASDYVLHSRSLSSHQLAQSTSHWNDQQLTSVSSTRSLKSKKCSSLRNYSKQHSTSSYEQSLKKSWLYPMTFMNCCLTRTDSVPDVFLDSTGTASSSSQSNFNNASITETNEQQQLVTLERFSGEPNGGQFAENLIEESMLIQSLNDLFLRTSRNSSPNQMISLNNQQTRSERERAIYLEEASGEAELNSSFNFSPPPPADDDEFQELRQILNNHQSSMSTFSHPDPNRLFPSSNYPLQLGRMLHALPVAGQSRSQSLQDSTGAHGEPSWNHHSPNPHSISNFSSVLPYPPPALYRSQRHLRAHNNPVHTQIDYINCLVPDLKAISSCSFYWGKMDRYEAERLLEGKPEGTFLLRDSAQEDHLFSVSFRRFDRSLHARIEQWKHRFSFDSHDPGVYSSTTVTGLIEHYKDPSHCMFFEPMLTKPLNRNFVFSLQHLARAGICDLIRYESINELPLPIVLKSYLRKYHISIKVRTKHFDEFTYYQ